MTTGTEPEDPGSAATLVTPGSVRATAVEGRGLPSGTSPAARKGMPLGIKFFLGAALLLVAVLGVSIAVATWRANQVAEKTIREALEGIPAIFGVYRNNLEAQARGSLHVIADEPGVKAFFDLDMQDPTSQKTVWDYVDAKAKVLGARTVFLFDREGSIVARSDKPAGEDVGRPFKTVRWVAEPIASWAEMSATIREGKVLSSVASVPVLAGDKEAARLVGVLAATFPLDARRTKALKGITGGQVAFLANTAKRGDTPKAEVSAETDGFGGDAFAAALAADAEATKALFVDGREIGPVDVVVGGDRRIVAAVPVKSLAGETLGAFVVSRSRDEETAAFREIRMALLGIGLAALLLALPVTFALGRRIARPLEQLAAGAVAIRDGNLDVKLPEAGSDEVGALARAFSAMVGELREKAQLEELLAEMQRRPLDSARTVVPETGSETVALQAQTVRSSASGPRVGYRFAGRYDILSVLGKGGMGSVYRALDRELDDEVALKVLTPEAFEQGTAAIQMLKQEIRLARKITHPNVVRTHDLGEADGVRFLTMEYAPGTTLKELVDRKGALALAPGIQISKQLCRGLAAVHEAGILHRDIKPHNIMVLPNGVVKLMDFGIAHMAEAVDSAAQAGQTVGTPYYMSPEQARAEVLDPRSDLYSVGVVIFELFTGERPIEGIDPMDVMRNHVLKEPKRPTLLRPDLPDILERIILACLSKGREKRPPSANDLYGALMRVAV